MAVNICPALPHGATKFFMRSVEHGAAAVAHVAVAEATSEKGGRQGLTLVQFSTQRKRFLWDRVCI